jgi:hypothetical protein
MCRCRGKETKAGSSALSAPHLEFTARLILLKMASQNITQSHTHTHNNTKSPAEPENGEEQLSFGDAATFTVLLTVVVLIYEMYTL